MSEGRPTSADAALVHLLCWWVVRSWGARAAHDPVIFGCLAEVLPAANRALPMIDAAARLPGRDAILEVDIAEKRPARLVRAPHRDPLRHGKG